MVSTWDRAKSIRAGFKPLEALAFDVLEWQPFRVVRHGTEDQIKAFDHEIFLCSVHGRTGFAMEGKIAITTMLQI